MTIFPLILDARPGYLAAGGSSSSLLLAPMGGGTLLQFLEERIRTVTGEPVLIAPTFAVDDPYLHALAESKARVLRVVTERSRTISDAMEPSDLLLLIDPRCIVLDESAFRTLVQGASPYLGARYLVALDRSHHGTHELLQMDHDGRVRRIQRYYDGHTWIQTQDVAAALVPVAALWDLTDPAITDLPRLRRALASCGALATDFPAKSPAMNLRVEGGYLQLNERTSPGVGARTPPAEYREHTPDIWIGPRCEIAPNARLYGPLLIQPGVRIGADSVLIGPSLIGSNSRIGPGVTLAKCVVSPNSNLAPHSVAHQRVLAGAVEGRYLPLRYDVQDEGLTGLLGMLDEQGPTAVHHKTQDHGRYLRFKAWSDTVVALAALVLLSPLMALVALAVKLTSRGPVFFGHEREGMLGRPFKCWKFRTMIVNAVELERKLSSETNEVDGPQFKLKRDPRVTPLGRFLRASNLDELAQLFNVVRGEMSLIGPRPSPFRENQICVPWRLARLSVRPGITGLWQVCRHQRASGDFHQWISYDILYAKNVSLWLDLKILIATILTGGGKWSVPLDLLISTRQAAGTAVPLVGELPVLSDTIVTPAPITTYAGNTRVA